MAKIIHLLAASIGGGIALGAGFRLGEVMAARDPRHDANGGRIVDRVQSAENRLARIECDRFAVPQDSGSGLAALQAQVETQQGQLAAIRAGLAAADRNIASFKEKTELLQSELREGVDHKITHGMEAAEERLRTTMETSHKEMLDAFTESLQNRVVQRISRLEETVAGQSAAMAELRDCSIQTERSLQKLLSGIDRLVSVQTPGAVFADPALRIRSESQSAGATASAETRAESPPMADSRRRWGIFDRSES